MVFWLNLAVFPHDQVRWLSDDIRGLGPVAFVHVQSSARGFHAHGHKEAVTPPGILVPCQDRKENVK